MTETVEADAKTEIFLDGLVKIVTDISKGGHQDKDMLMRVGSLAVHMMGLANTDSWPEYKSGLEPDKHAAIINAFSKDIETAGNKGDLRTAYAMQAVAASLVGARFDDERIKHGIDLLDRFIESARATYFRNAPKPH